MDFLTKNFLLVVFGVVSLTLLVKAKEVRDESIAKTDQKIQIFPPELEAHLLNENHDDTQYFDIDAFQDNPAFPDLTPNFRQIRRKNDRQLFGGPEDIEPTHNLDDSDVDDDKNNVKSGMKTVAT